METRAGVEKSLAVALAVAASWTLGAWIAPGVAHGQATDVAALRAELAGMLAAHRGAGVGQEHGDAASVPDGALHSIDFMLTVAARIENSFPADAVQWRARAERFMARVREGHDPFPEQRGKIVNRTYPQSLSTEAQGYAVYLPPDYDPSRAYPLMIALHGGSSNGNLFLGVVLGNNMSWLHYNQYLYNEFEPRWFPDMIVAAPTGYGQVMWRWMGEQDVLDVVADIERHYNVDPDRVILAGLSNGGVGAYAIGMRHAWRFSMVQAMAGAPSWLQYAGGSPAPPERIAMERFSGMHLTENGMNTDFRAYHGYTDTGPMRPNFFRDFAARVEALDLPVRITWFDAGHDILYRVQRHGRTFADLAQVRRNRSPTEVRVLTGDYRANRQHWVTVTRILDYPKLARVRATVDGGRVDIEAENVRALSIDLRDMPGAGEPNLRVHVNGAQIFAGSRAQAGHVLHLVRNDEGAFAPGFPDEPADQLAKRPGLAGPLTDAYYGEMVHVYGTAIPEATPALEQAARRGSHGWPLWLWQFSQRVVADTEVTDEMMRTSTLVLYGIHGSNRVLERIHNRLPIRIESDAVAIGQRRYEGRDVGTRFIYPNPLAEGRYVIVQGGVTTAAVAAGNNLPDFLPDYVVYQGSTPRNAQRLTTRQSGRLALGYFDERWRPPPSATGEGAGDEDAGVSAPETSSLPVPTPPPDPAPPRRFLAQMDDPAGPIARAIARRVATFRNFRAETHGAEWRTAPAAVFSIRSSSDCLAATTGLDLVARSHPALETPVPSPMEITGPVAGVWLRITHEDRPLLVSCELAARLPAVMQRLRAHGVLGVEIMSAYRDRPRASFHTMGMGLDMARFWTNEGWLSVLDDYVETPDQPTCDGPEPRDPRARRLRRIACDLFRSNLVSTVLTPNYNEGHRDHLHIDIRPDDPRVFVR